MQELEVESSLTTLGSPQEDATMGLIERSGGQPRKLSERRSHAALLLLHPDPDQTSATNILMSSSPSTETIRLTYRQIYKALLLACQYSVPARYVARNTVRKAFRSSPASAYNPERIANTLRFLNSAAQRTGIEHKIVKNILTSRYWYLKHEGDHWKGMKRHAFGFKSREMQQGYESLQRTIEMLNQTMGLCLK